MRAIINGKRYDTASARNIGSCSSGGSTDDFHFWEENLYVTKTGVYFIAGEGGPLSRFSKQCGSNNGSCGGERITPVSKADAMAWAEDRGLFEVLEEHFADEIEDL
jgi:hypothetical protein